MVPLGMAQSSAALIGNSIGANNVGLAKRFFYLILKIVVPLTAIMATIPIFACRQIVGIFTTDDELAALATPLMIIAGCNFFADGIQGILAGPIRALSLQKTAGYIALGCYWLVGIPTAGVLAFKYDMSVNGLYLGLIAATALQALLYLAILLFTDWQEIADNVAKRISKEEEKAAEEKSVEDSDSY